MAGLFENYQLPERDQKFKSSFIFATAVDVDTISANTYVVNGTNLPDGNKNGYVEFEWTGATGASFQRYTSTPNGQVYFRYGNRNEKSWENWQRLDNFGYNSLADLAGGVAGMYGLPNLNKSGIDMSGAVYGGEDLNTVINAGCYHGSRDVLNLPEGVSNYWVMLVFSYISQWRVYVQLLSCHAGNKMYIRYRWQDGDFGAWKEL